MTKVRTRMSVFMNRIAGPVLVLPALLFYVPFTVLPIIGTLFFVLFKWSGTGLQTMQYIGLRNFSELLQDPVFWIALRNNFLLGAIAVSGQILLGLIVAILLTQERRLSQFYQVLFMVPLTLSYIVVSVLANLLFSPTFQVMNTILRRVGLGFLANPWLADLRTAFVVIVLVVVWKSFGFAMLIFVARIKGIPGELYEAAMVDGASWIQRSWHITLPLLRPIIAVVVMIEVINAFRMFDVIFTLTEGGPNNATQVMATYAYLNAFYYSRMGYGTTISIVLLAICALVTGLQLRSVRRESVP